MLLRNKRGDERELYFIIYQLVFLAVITLSVFWYVFSVADNSLFWRNYYAKDTALTLDALHAGQGDTEIGYNLIYGEVLFNFSITDERVEVYDIIDDPKQKPIPEVLYYAQDEKIKVNKTHFIPYYLSFQKKGDKIFVGQSGLDVQTCPLLNTKPGPDQTPKIFVKSAEPGQGLQHEANNEGAITMPIKRALEQHLTREGYQITTEAEADLVMYLALNQDDKETLRAGHNSLEASQKLACLVYNNVLAKFKDRYDARELGTSSQLPSGKTAARIELGSIKNANEINIFDAAVTLHLAIKQYYS